MKKIIFPVILYFFLFAISYLSCISVSGTYCISFNKTITPSTFSSEPNEKEALPTPDKENNLPATNAKATSSLLPNNGPTPPSQATTSVKDPSYISQNTSISIIEKHTSTTTHNHTTTKPTQTTIPTTSPSKINIKNYKENISYNNFTETDKKLINDIFALYHSNKDQNKVEKQLDYEVDIESYYKVTSFFFIYYGKHKEIADIMFDITIRTTNNGRETSLTIYPPIISEIEKERKENTDFITQKISQINEGTEKEKIRQIIEIISKNTKYDEEARTVKDILRYGKGNCNAYALLFARYCQLLNIQCDICIGTVPSGKHPWNKVTYKDGSVEYFDITFYDTGKTNSEKYLFMKNSHYDVEAYNFYFLDYFE